MRKIRDVLRLRHEAGLSQEKIARAVGISKGAVAKYLSLSQAQGLGWPLPADLDDTALERQLFPVAGAPVRLIEPDFPTIHQELKRKGVTLQLLWSEYATTHGEQAYRYSRYCDLYRDWAGRQKRSMRQLHQAGKKLFIDYCGPTVEVVDPASGEIRHAQIFVAVLGASSYTYAEATWSQGLPDWIASHQRAFAFFGGVPGLLVPDNLRSAVRHPCRYAPEPNETYQELARHYATAILPARPYKPQDKAKAEVGVQVVERWILARLRHHTFLSLDQLNGAVNKLLEELNERPFQKLPGSRKSAFESLDRPALKPLPASRYDYAEWKQAKAGIDYHSMCVPAPRWWRSSTRAAAWPVTSASPRAASTGKCDFEAAEGRRQDDYFRAALGLKRVPPPAPGCASAWTRRRWTTPGRPTRRTSSFWNGSRCR